MPHYHGIHDEAILESELILAQLADTLASVHSSVSGSGLEITPEYFHEGGFTRAVRADEAVAVAVTELDGNVFEQGFCPKLHSDIGSGNQGGRFPEKEDGKIFNFTRNFGKLSAFLCVFTGDCIGSGLILYHCSFEIKALFHENNFSGFRAAHR